MTYHTKDTLWLDFETYSEVALKKCGADIYTRHHSTLPLMLAWAVGDDTPALWMYPSLEDIPAPLQRFLLGGEGIIRAHNSNFDRSVFTNTMGLHTKLSQWEDTQVTAHNLSFAGPLGTITAAIGFGEDKAKDKAGRGLIQKFCKPISAKNRARRDEFSHPEEWGAFCNYALQDIISMRAMWEWCQTYGEVPDSTWELWRLDQEINARGLPVDFHLVDRALHALTLAKGSLEAEIHELTGLPKITPQPLLSWIQEQGCAMENMQKATKEAAVSRLPEDSLVKQVLEASLLIAQASSSSKWSAIDARGDRAAGILRNTLQFMGASRTARWAGRGVQLQNLKRPPVDMVENIDHILSGKTATMDQISTSIRGAFKAPPGKVLVVSDLSSIESRLAGWVTGCGRINDTFAQGKDTYKDLATELFKVPYYHVTKEQRTFAKPASLGCQYMLGAGGLVAYAAQYGVDLDLATAKAQVATYREAYPELPEFWGWAKRALHDVVTTGTYHSRYGLTLMLFGEFLFVCLPSGRRLSYFRPAFVDGPAPWDATQTISKFQYEGMGPGSQWCKIHAHAGGFLENVIQAIARDVLAVWIQRVNAAGHVIIGHVHDEIITVCDTWDADHRLEELNALAAAPIGWAPNLQLTAAGYISERYKKD